MSELKFDIQTRPRAQVQAVHQRIVTEVNKKLSKERLAEAIREAIDSLGLKFNNDDNPETATNASQFVAGERQSLLSVISMTHDTLEQEAEMFIVRAMEEGGVVGFFNGIIEPEQSEAYMVDYLTRPDKQRQGIAKNLHKYMVGQLRARGIKRIATIMDDDKEGGRALLKSQGYKAQSESDDNEDFYLDI